MGIGLSTYTLDWPGATNLFRQLFYAKPELNALKLNPPVRHRVKGGENVHLTSPENLVGARAYRVEGSGLRPGGCKIGISKIDAIHDCALKICASQIGA